jgi:hypothetical protein
MAKVLGNKTGKAQLKSEKVILGVKMKRRNQM